MPRIPAAPAFVLAAALALLLMPRAWVAPLLDRLRPETAPPVSHELSAREVFEAGYPPALFADAGNRVLAPVYALGPGYRHELAIAQGSDRGIRVGDVATMPIIQQGPGTFVGVVREARASRASLQTLADPAWRSAVRVGSSSVDALLVGGLAPTLTLIPKGAPVAAGDAVVSADPQLPYGLVMGTVAEVRDAADGVLREAGLALPYALGSLRAVDVVATGDVAGR